MKKLISLMLALIMILSLATTAFAEETTTNNSMVDTSGWVAPGRIETITLFKVYEVTGAKDNAKILPDETLTFTVAGTPAIQVAAIDVNTLTAVEGEAGVYSGSMAITLPEYNAVGQYDYTVTEVPGDAQGATYTNPSIGFTVLVTYDYVNSCLKSELILTTSAGNNSGEIDGENNTVKLDTFTNIYELGHLSVTKTVDGNLADKGVEFEMTVTLTSDNPVKSDITVMDGSTDTDAVTTVAGDGWTENEVTINVKHGETVNFYNIPAGVTYTIEESADHLLGETETAPDPNSDTAEDYKITAAENLTGEIAANETQAASITNWKGTSISTGVITDSAPYIILIAVCAVAAVAFVFKRRTVEF